MCAAGDALTRLKERETAQTAKAPRKKASSSNGSSRKAASARTKSSTSTRSKPRSSAQSNNGSGSIPATAVAKTKQAAHTVGAAASKAKTPLIAGGTALVGAAAGAVMKDR